MAKILLSFLSGAIITSAFWSVTVVPPGTRGSAQMILPALGTVALFFAISGFICNYWDDK